jgi:hypothetical protein
MDKIEADILDLVNLERSQRHLAPVRLDEDLRRIAREHSADMWGRDFFAHINPSGEDSSDRIGVKHRKLIGITGENIWSMSGFAAAAHPALAKEIMQDWMNSPGHRANILRNDYTHLGVGVSLAGTEVRATQNFAGIRGMLNVPLPDAVRRGAAVDLSITSPGSAPNRFEIFSKEKGIAIAGPVAMSPAKLDAAPGTYVLRFHFRQSSGSDFIYDGPKVQIQ